MKKFLLFIAFFLTMFATTAIAQVQTYRSTSFALAEVYNGRYVWGDWESSDVTITIDLNRDVITIYSPVTQRYRVISVANNGNVIIDESGGKQIKFFVIDQDGDRGTVRIRIERNGNSQLYVDFNDIAFVYNVKRIS